MTSRQLPLLAALVVTSPALASESSSALDFDFAQGLEALDGVAQDDEEDEDDALDDILGSDDKEESTVAEEKRAVESGEMNNTAGASDDELAALDENARTKRTIKVLQKKNFLKIGRGEGGIHAGFLSNDPFINRYLIGINGSYHITEVFSVELSGTFSPDFGQSDWKPITRQLVNENKVSPDISKLIWVVNATTQFSPIYGKLAVVGGNIIVFDIYGIFGFGLAGTQDDLDAIQCEGRDTDPCSVTASQVHPTTTIGGGLRVAFSKRVAARIEGRSLSYIETLDGTSLEMKNNLLLQAMGTLFFDVRRD